MRPQLCTLCSDAKAIDATTSPVGPVCAECATVLRMPDVGARRERLRHILRPRSPFTRPMRNAELDTLAQAFAPRGVDVAAERIPEGRLVAKTTPTNPHDD